MELFAERIMPECRCAVINFSGQGVGYVCGTRSLRYILLQKTPEKDDTEGNILDSFLLDTLKTTF